MEPYTSAILIPLFQRVAAGHARIILSTLTEAELLVRPLRDGDGPAVERIADFLSEDGIDLVQVSRPIARLAAALRARHRMSLADAIIVATAIESGCEAVVTNDGQYARRLTEIPYVLLDALVEERPDTKTTGARSAGKEQQR